MARLIYPHGAIEKVLPAGKKWSLAELQGHVGGLIQIVPGSKPNALCNEEGLVFGMPYNQRASVEFGQSLVGPVLVLERGERW